MSEDHEVSADLRDAQLPTLIAAMRSDSGPERERSTREILRRFHPLIRKYWYRHAVSEYEDFLQEVMVRLFTALPRLRDEESFPGLLRNIVVAAAADFYRKKQPPSVSIDAVSPEVLGEDFDQALATPLLVRSYMEVLPPREREVLYFSYLEDLSPSQIAARLGVTAGAVRMTKARALRRLHKLLAISGKEPTR